MKATKTMWKVHIGRLPFVIPLIVHYKYQMGTFIVYYYIHTNCMKTL